MIYIYALVDPNTAEIRYIGKSIRPRERLMNQCNEKANTYRSHWIQSLVTNGQRPVQFILETLPDDAAWQSREQFWIAHGREKGWPLTNTTDGGDGVTNLSGESKERMLKTWKGRKHRPESLLKIGAASKGRYQSAEAREKRSKALKGRQFSPEARQKLSDGVRKFTEDDVDEIRMFLESGFGVQEVAIIFGVHRGTISKIKKGEYP